ncbi:hypothetical protein KI387_002646 [Taxus chinensis]|uniref:AP2/ERF domain-containing protein n=1 Tax=Taxus chinensis TaxID=29808 RepID=A0AA38GXY7_TAXCH|nr:hypothetical protein KI387_002646 [Taxus chinensis]
MKNSRSAVQAGEEGVCQPKPKRSRNSIRRDTPPKRSSIYRGVTRIRFCDSAIMLAQSSTSMGFNPALLNQIRNVISIRAGLDPNSAIMLAQSSTPMGFNPALLNQMRHVVSIRAGLDLIVCQIESINLNYFLGDGVGAYDDEEAAAHAYDLAALKYWGPETVLNFPISTYLKEVEEMKNISKEEYVSSLRRHHHNGRWEARIGRVFGNKYLYLGTYSTQEEAAAAYDMAAIEYRGLNAVTNFDLSRYIKWLRPSNGAQITSAAADKELNLLPLITNQKEPADQSDLQDNTKDTISSLLSRGGGGGMQPPAHEMAMQAQTRSSNGSTSTALGLLLQSSKFKEMVERSSSIEASHAACEPGQISGDYSEEMDSLFEGSEYILNQSHEEFMLGSSNNLMMSMLHHAVNVPSSTAYDHLQLQTICTNTELMDHESLIDLMNSTVNNSSNHFIQFGSHSGSSS